MALNLSRNTKVFVSSVNGVTSAGGNVATLSNSLSGTNSGHAVGDIVTFGTTNGSGSGFKAIVAAVNSGAATELIVPNNFRGTGYAASNTVTSTASSGSGANGLVATVATISAGKTADSSRTGLGLFKGNEKDANTFRIGVLDGYSFSQSSESTDVTINEAGDAPKRGSQRFNDSLAPAEWSFQTYVRPFKHGANSFRDTTAHDMVENVLWAALAGQALPTAEDSSDNSGATTNSAITYQASNTKVDFASSNAHELLKLTIFFALENTTYRLNECQVNQVEIDFSIDGIATLSWSGNATSIDQVNAAIEDPSKAFHDKVGVSDTDTSSTLSAYVEKLNYVDVTATSDADYLRNKLSTMTLAHQMTAARASGGVLDTAGGTTHEYTGINITGGSITIANNVTYLTPETLGIVDQPIGSFTGSRTISGSLTCYLDTAAGGSNELLSDLSAATNLVSNKFDMSLFMGGASTATPLVTFDIPRAHLQIPTIETADIISTTIEFAAQGTTITSTDEMTVLYKGSTVHSDSGYDKTASNAV